MIQKIKTIPVQLVVTVSVVLIFGILGSIRSGWNQKIRHVDLDVHFFVRGDRPVSEDIALVFIGPEDLQELGGWPLSRDYYGYLIHVLDSFGCRTIGLDVMFLGPDRIHPEYDQLLADFIGSASNVVLPMTFMTMAKMSNGELAADGSAYPLSQIGAHASGFGFSNLGNDLIIRSVPVVSRYDNKPVLSFGAEMARDYLGSPKDVLSDGDILGIADSSGHWHRFTMSPEGEILLNHFGDIEQVQSTSLLNVFKIFRSRPDSVFLKNKLVMVAVTAPGIAAMVSTPINNLIPASLIHLTVAENILTDCFIYSSGLISEWILLIILVISAWLIGSRAKQSYAVFWLAVMVIMSWLLVHFLFSYLNIFISFFYAGMAFLISAGLQLVIRSCQRRSEEQILTAMLNEQVATKTRQLHDAKAELETLQAQLSQEENATLQHQEVVSKQAQTIHQLEKELRDLKEYSHPEGIAGFSETFEDIIHSESGKFSEILKLIQKVSTDDIPVLILGETGTGKELIARTIHRISHRRSAPFVAVNCGALSETLLESELFGHEKGSFTGAVARRRGRFELASGGTIFLDEISETSLSFQAKLLRVLQEKEFERIGGERTISADVRVIAATNRDLQKEQETGRFRTDLFYRLNGIPIMLPPLRDRSEDIPLIAIHFLHKYATAESIHFSDRVMELLKHYAWPGNVRELENAVRRATILAQSEHRDRIQVNDLPDEIQADAHRITLEDLHLPLEEQILASLRRLQFSRSSIKRTAEALGKRDRGTITEYFRGICFEQLVASAYDIDVTTTKIADSQDPEMTGRVRLKLEEYIKSITAVKASNAPDGPTADSLYKGLPKKYHGFLTDILSHYSV